MSLPQYVLDLLKNIAETENFVNFKTKYQDGSNRGDGFLGVLTSVIIEGTRITNGVPAEDKLYLLCKLAPENEIRRKIFQTALIFEREANTYNKILPLFRQFQQDQGLSDDESFLAFPKCYAAVADEEQQEFAVIMEDVRAKGFTMWKGKKVLPADHSYHIMEQLGKFHGISFALKDQQANVYNELKVYQSMLQSLLKIEQFAKWFEMSHDRAIEALEKVEHKEIMEEVKANMKQLADECLLINATEFGVIGHGDCHNNNILYRYNNEVRANLLSYFLYN